MCLFGFPTKLGSVRPLRQLTRPSNFFLPRYWQSLPPLIHWPLCPPSWLSAIAPSSAPCLVIRPFHSNHWPLCPILAISHCSIEHPMLGYLDHLKAINTQSISIHWLSAWLSTNCAKGYHASSLLKCTCHDDLSCYLEVGLCPCNTTTSLRPFCVHLAFLAYRLS